MSTLLGLRGLLTLVTPLLGHLDFLATQLFRRLSHEMEPDELKARALARQLLSYGNANDIFRNQSDDVPLATFTILKRWKNTNRRLEEGAMVSKRKNRYCNLSNDRLTFKITEQCPLKDI